MKTRPVERRFTPGEVEVRTRGSKTYIEGHAAVWNTLSQNLGGFVENVRSGAFTKTIKEADVRGLLNHDPMYILGRNKAETLDLAEDASGLYYRIDPPDTSYARDLLVSLERKDITQSSFAFRTIEDEWGYTEQDFPLRTLVEVSLVDVSPVTYPAYLTADSGLGRSYALAGLSKRSGIEVADLSDVDAIKRAIAGDAEETPAPETPADTTAQNRWAKRAEVLARLAQLDTL